SGPFGPRYRSARRPFCRRILTRRSDAGTRNGGRHGKSAVQQHQMTEKKKFSFSGSSLRAYVMIVVLAAIWIYFHFATYNSTPDFTDIFAHIGSFFSGIGSAAAALF